MQKEDKRRYTQKEPLYGIAKKRHAFPVQSKNGLERCCFEAVFINFVAV